MPMFESQLVMQEEDFQKILAVIQRLTKDANAKGVFVVDKNGQLIGEAGAERLQITKHLVTWSGAVSDDPGT